MNGQRDNLILSFSENVKLNIPAISIVTVVLNDQKYIDYAIQSVLSQSYPQIEYIIIDGGSTDCTIEIIKKYESSVTKWISEPDMGISDAFNKGINIASGELIGIVNSDDWLEPSSLNKIVEIYRSKNPDVICGAVRFWENEKEVVVSYPDVQNITRETSIHHSGVFIKKSIYEKFGLYNTSYKYAMDYELLLRLKMDGAKFYVLNEVIANRRLEGVSYKNRNLALKETKLIRRKYFSTMNVNANYFSVWMKDLAGRMFKKGFLKPLYQNYWKLKNQKLIRDKSQ